jgi:hypothetical protein
LPLSVAHALRQNKSAPLVKKFKEWVDTLLPGTPPNSALGKALAYCVRQWPKLVLFLEHGETWQACHVSPNRQRPVMRRAARITSKNKEVCAKTLRII